jgi:hypothetical protein
MDKQDEEIIKKLIAEGIVGGTLATILTKGKEENILLATVAGAAILASYKARENAKKSNIPLLIERDGSLYQVKSDGSEVFIKTISRSRRVRKTFNLK